jgi:hypothetical protein
VRPDLDVPVDEVGAGTDLVLRAGVHHVKIDDARVMFDLAKDRYFLLNGSIAESFERFLAGKASEDDQAILSSNDLVSPGEADNPGDRKPHVSPAASLIDAGLPNGTLFGVGATLWRMRHVRAQLRHRSLADVLGRMTRPEQEDSNPDAETAIAICLAANFWRARRFSPLTDQCLVRGIAMMDMLGQRGIAASLVFGVTMPFAAHCWVQVGEQVLTDPLDIVRHYQPIYTF